MTKSLSTALFLVLFPGLIYSHGINNIPKIDAHFPLVTVIFPLVLGMLSIYILKYLSAGMKVVFSIIIVSYLVSFFVNHLNIIFYLLGPGIYSNKISYFLIGLFISVMAIILVYKAIMGKVTGYKQISPYFISILMALSFALSSMYDGIQLALKSHYIIEIEKSNSMSLTIFLHNILRGSIIIFPLSYVKINKYYLLSIAVISAVPLLISYYIISVNIQYYNIVSLSVSISSGLIIFVIFQQIKWSFKYNGFISSKAVLFSLCLASLFFIYLNTMKIGL